MSESFHLEHQFSGELISSCSKEASLKELIDPTNLVSFGSKNVKEKLMSLGKSMTLRRKRRVPHTLHCGAPECIGREEGVASLMCT